MLFDVLCQFCDRHVVQAGVSMHEAHNLLVEDAVDEDVLQHLLPVLDAYAAGQSTAFGGSDGMGAG